MLFIGRKEITVFFYFYMALTFTSLLLDSGVIPPGNGAYSYFSAAQNGFTSALCVCLLVNGFVGFQLYEDGTSRSVWLLRLVSAAIFIINFLVSLATFKGWAGLGPDNTIGLFVVLYIINAVCLLVYVVMQIILVANTLQDRWPLGDIAFGTFFFIIGQVILYVFSDTICRAIQHYLDGLFFATICNLLAVMMVYKVRIRLGAGPFRLRASFANGNTLTVLGLDYPRGPRVLCRHEAEQLGDQGVAPRRRSPQHRLPGRRQHRALPVLKRHVPAGRRTQFALRGLPSLLDVVQGVRTRGAREGYAALFSIFFCIATLGVWRLLSAGTCVIFYDFTPHAVVLM